jgi:hypothetical protein
MKKTANKPATRAEIAEVLSLSISRVDQLIAAGLPKPLDVSTAIQWMFAFGPWRSERARDDMLRAAVDKASADE